MPTYNYKCKSCKNITIILQKMSDPSLKSCEKCKGDLKRIISGDIGLIFRGNGFYLTDYVRKNKTNKENKKVVKAPKNEIKNIKENNE